MTPISFRSAQRHLAPMTSGVILAVVVSVALAQTPTPTPIPTPVQVNLSDPPASVKYTETLWESVGSKYPLQPLSGPAAGSLECAYRLKPCGKWPKRNSAGRESV